MKKFVICMSLLIGQAWSLSGILPELNESVVHCPSQSSDDDDDEESICFGSS